MTGVEKHYTIL